MTVAMENTAADTPTAALKPSVASHVEPASGSANNRTSPATTATKTPRIANPINVTAT